ncbi:response regulator [Candidatus Kaiserbacteria bacterium]|nr:response regulator [Candidatus Kaiserbacteria bacterium]
MAQRFLSQYVERFGLQVAGLFILYCILGRLGLSINPVHTFAALVWPAAGVGLAALVIYGYRLWPAIALGAFVINLSVGAGFFVALGMAAGNTLEALAAAYVLRHYARFNPRLRHLRDNIWFIAVALTAPLLSALIGVGSAWFGGQIPSAAFLTAATTWWVGDMVGILVVAPFIFKWFPGPPLVRTPAQYLELCLAVGAVFCTAVFVFWTPQMHLTYYVFVPLAWVALRTGPRGITFALFIAAATAVSGTLLGLGPYTVHELFELQLFLGTMSALFLVLTTVVEERKEAQVLLGHHVDELERALSKASSEDKAKKDFLSILAHELRNPLAAILSSAELLRLQEVHAPDTAALLQTIDDRIRSMTVMLDDLLDISRISHNKLTLRKETISMDSVIDRSVRTSQAFIRSRGHTLSVRKPEQDLYLEADPIRLEQIIVNLLNNAAKYTNQNGSIEFSTKKDGDAAVITVCDNGIGIQKNMLERIFEPFFQIGRGSLPTQGLGVGLPLTRQLVELHGGTVKATSQGEGKGSQFTVRLPLPVHIQPPPASVPRRRLRGGTVSHVKNTRTILVVDDNEVAANALARLLELRGHEVSVAYTGAEAVKKARELRPDIIILDIGLPDIDGYEVVRMLKEDKKFSSGLIALTGYAQPEDKQRAYKAGFHMHCTKPVGLKELEAAFRKLPLEHTH